MDRPAASSPPQTQPLLEWRFPEYQQYPRTLRWYVAVVIVAAGLLAYAFWSQNYLLVVIVVVAGLIVAWQTLHPPENVTVRITEDGVALVGQRQYLYKDLRNFYLIYRPPHTKKLYLAFRSLRPAVPIPLMQQNPAYVRQTLLRFLPEDVEREHEPVAESVGRLLKF